MSTSEPRPPTILGPWGEGYCRVCHFIEALSEKGLLEPHWRGRIINERYEGEKAKPCAGSDRRPTKLTPFTSKLAAFRLSAPTGTCGVCGQGSVPLHSYGDVLGQHVNGAYRTCPGSFKPPAVR